jgi:hypothetical protein
MTNQADNIKYRKKGSCDPRKMRWVCDGGSVFTEELVESKSDFGATIQARISIAFNVGEEIGQRMVSLQNDSLAQGRTGT